MGKTIDSLLISTAEMITAKNLLDDGDNVLVCVSGGADSVALLHIMTGIQKRFGITIGVAHLNHELRGEESDRDSSFVKTITETAGLQLHFKSINVNIYQQKHRLSPEDAARQVRYSFFNEIAEKYGYTKIATAHTANDNAELVLMNLFRGSGPSGLSGIPFKRGNIIRPFLNTSRESVINYLYDNKINYVSDSSNLCRDYLRNRVRLDLLPHLRQEYNENIIDSLNRTSTNLKEEEAWIEDIILPVFENIITDRQSDSISLSVKQLRQQPLAARRRIIRKAIGCIKGDLKKITLFHTDLVVEMSDNIKATLSVDLPDRIQVKKERDSIAFTRHSTSLRDLSKNEYRYTYQIVRLETSVTTVNLPDISMKMIFSLHENADMDHSEKKIAWLDLNRLTFPLTIRNLRPKDKFVPFGMTGSQTLKKFFSGISISGNDKKRCPLLLSNNDIIWIGGHRIDNRYRLRPDTKKVLKVELFLD